LKSNDFYPFRRPGVKKKANLPSGRNSGLEREFPVWLRFGREFEPGARNSGQKREFSGQMELFALIFR